MLKNEYSSVKLYRVRLLGKLKSGFPYIGGLLLLETALIAILYFFNASGDHTKLYQLSPVIFMTLIPCAALPLFLASNPEIRHNNTLCISEKTVLEVDYTIIGLFALFAAIIGVTLPLFFRLLITSASLPTDILQNPYNISISSFFIEFGFGLMLGLMTAATIYAIMRARTASISAAVIIILAAIAFSFTASMITIPIMEKLNVAVALAVAYSLLTVVAILANVGAYFVVKKGDALR